jgi:hypothetical protein
MKKVLLYLLAIAAISAISAVSCQSEKDYFGSEIPPGEMVAIQLSPTLPAGITPLTSTGGGAAVLDENTYALRYILEVYSQDGTQLVVPRKIEVADNFATPVNFTVELPAAEYQFVFWADFTDKDVNEGKNDLLYNTANAGGLKDIEWLTPSGYYINSDLRDAYTAVEPIDLTEGDVSNFPVTLRRPFGKMRLLATDLQDAVPGEAGAPAKVLLTYTSPDPAAFSKRFNALTGAPGTETISAAAIEGVPVKEASVTVGEQTFTNVWLLAFDYFFVPTSLKTVTFDFEVFDGDNNAITDGAIAVATPVPIGVNKLTTVIGAIGQNVTQWSVDIGDAFGGTSDVERSDLPIPSGLKHQVTMVDGVISAALTWKGDASMDSYEIDLNGTPYTAITNSTTINNLEELTDYTWRVRAVKDGKTSEWSYIVDFRTPAGPARYRGIGLNMGAISEADFIRLAGWGVNHGRWNFENWDDDLANQTPTEYLAFITAECDKLEAMLPVLEAQGITVNINIHMPPRNRDEANGNVYRMFQSRELQTAFVDGWKIIANRFKDEPAVVYYDLLNEPAVGTLGQNCKNWRNLAIETANAIRAIDNTKKFIFEQINDKYKDFQPLPGNDWLYSIHVYTPHLLTHQGVLSTAPLGVSYPGTITEVIWVWPQAPDYWYKATLRQYLVEVSGAVDFAKNNNVEIYVGEFGCARWAPNHSAYNYIRDCLEIFEEEGWHWAYFQDGPYATENYAANTWSAQYDEVHNSDTPQSEPTDRLLLLQQQYWGRNRK